MKWAIPKKRDGGFFAVPIPKPRPKEKDPAFGDFNSPMEDEEVERDAERDSRSKEPNGSSK